MAILIPPFGNQTVVWKQQARQGSRADRTLSRIEVAVPTRIKDLAIALNSKTGELVREAQFEAVRFDQESISRGLGISALLMQTESIASSRIERIGADSLTYLRATVGQKLTPESVAMAAGLKALKYVISNTEYLKPLDLDVILEGHRLLLADDQVEQRYAGVIRDVQNWIGGSQFSPRNADYIPPAPHAVKASIKDLFSATARRDLEPIVLASLIHAQFESIHPFTDGNGRMGRAIISALLKACGLTTQSVIPVASAYLGDRKKYIQALESYRAGDAEPIITITALAILCASQTGREYLPELAGLLDHWRHKIDARAGSAAARILPLLLTNDTLNIGTITAQLEISTPAANDGIAALEASGVVVEITGRTRDRYWVAPEIIDLWSEYSAEVGDRFSRLV